MNKKFIREFFFKDNKMIPLKDNNENYHNDFQTCKITIPDYIKYTTASIPFVSHF